jgi:polysaccharide export outer membrane protein
MTSDFGHAMARLTRLAVLALILGLAAFVSPAAAQGYKVRPGDILKLEIVEDPTLDRALLVAPDGRISLPQAGTLKVSGLSVDAIGTAIAGKLAASFTSPPTVSVSLQQLAERVPSSGAVAATTDIYILGEANKPGKLALAPRTTLLQAFAEMGGFTKFAATKRIQLRRTDAKTGAPIIFTVNYQAIEAGQTADGNITLRDGDVIMVPQRRLFE